MDYKTLYERQHWTLAQKIDHSLGVIDQFASHYPGKVYVSFSGGKDSCVMLSLVEMLVPDVPCVFVMTGCESPSVCRFIRQMQNEHNIEIIRPEKTLKQVFAECGFPLVSKQVAHDIHAVRRNPYCKSSRWMLWRGNPHCISERWMYLLNEPYEVSDRCCFWLKKKPCHDYTKRTGRHPFLGILASESWMRTKAYISRGGCNSFNDQGKAHPVSMPLAIWNDDDIWAYIKDRQLSLPDIYGKGVDRTGCMGCGFGVNTITKRMETLRRLWPKWYDLVMSYENNGIRYGDALQRMLQVTGKEYDEDNDDIQTVQGG